MVLIFLSLNLFSQTGGHSVNDMFQTGKWYAIKKNGNSKMITYSHAEISGAFEIIEFKNDSILISYNLKQDSLRIYKIKMDVIRIRLPKRNYEYFRYCFMGKYLQLTPINP